MDAKTAFLILYLAGIAILALTGAGVMILFYAYWQARECVRIREELRRLREKLKERRRQLQKLLVELEGVSAQLAEAEKQLEEKRPPRKLAGT